MEVKLHFLYKHPTLPSVPFESDWIQDKISLAIISDFEKTGRMKELKIEDDFGQTWNLKEFKKLMTQKVEQKTNVSIEFDGSFHKENGQSGIGVVLHYSESNKRFRVRENNHLNHLKSNNEAEYAALYRSIQLCEELLISHQKIAVVGDSLVVINQLNDEWPCYDQVLNNWLDKIEVLCKKNNLKIEATAVRREKNKEADKLASQAIEGIFIQSKTEIM
ncbi:reverse transcriptase-like protein [Jeotgalibacillus marinus]|uniref:Reverse transcriptase-like protein n=1 Tax=Jeotgalibacillus marinus TaxID=86667 RepID=A0ABV3Q3K3_9BACL